MHVKYAVENVGESSTRFSMDVKTNSNPVEHQKLDQRVFRVKLSVRRRLFVPIALPSSSNRPSVKGTVFFISPKSFIFDYFGQKSSELVKKVFFFLSLSENEWVSDV